MMKQAENNAKKPLPKVEKFPVNFYEDGIEHFSMACKMRQFIAMKHYYGEKNYSFYDLTQALVNKNIKEFQLEGDG